MFTTRQIHSRKDKLAFVRMLWDIYADDPNWVPPMEMDRMKLIDEKKNPFYEHSDAAFFIAEENGKIIGRIAAIINHNHNRVHNDKVGFFGFFECIDRSEVAQALFSEAEKYLRDRGMTSVRGPYNPSANDEAGLLVEGFDRPPVLLMTYNPPYYIKLIEECGYAKVMDLYAWLLSTATARSEKLIRVTKALQERSQVTIRPFNRSKFSEEVGKIKALYNAAWEMNWGFVPMTDKEFDALAKDLKPVYDPDLIFFAEKDGETIGFSLSIPDMNQAFHGRADSQSAQGLRVPATIPRGIMNLPISLWNLFTKKKKIDTLRILVLGIDKAYRSLGIDAMLYNATIEAAAKKGFTYGEASWVLENNDPMNRACEMMNGKRYKTYRVYEKGL